MWVVRSGLTLVCKGFSKFDTRQTQTINSMKTVHVQMPSTLKVLKRIYSNSVNIVVNS